MSKLKMVLVIFIFTSFYFKHNLFSIDLLKSNNDNEKFYVLKFNVILKEKIYMYNNTLNEIRDHIKKNNGLCLKQANYSELADKDEKVEDTDDFVMGKLSEECYQ